MLFNSYWELLFPAAVLGVVIWWLWDNRDGLPFIGIVVGTVLLVIAILFFGLSAIALAVEQRIWTGVGSGFMACLGLVVLARWWFVLTRQRQ